MTTSVATRAAVSRLHRLTPQATVSDEAEFTPGAGSLIGGGVLAAGTLAANLAGGGALVGAVQVVVQ